ncbi:uncharacterized protein [Blastocystis hominis]|uniref:Uncharacterized protein n=1 Tax=Blastocystis hominis TaxID=12968 RepID=D8M1G7_BLAHO|nr:uncharacterized protein [Blastocystis hominis]CBK21906.2 unnamed protein product [Blastocystis hominis]|eukprot:XP_012895954.1 uncharacterized protein [Blastocystis hominis]
MSPASPASPREPVQHSSGLYGLAVGSDASLFRRVARTSSAGPKHA